MKSDNKVKEKNSEVLSNLNLTFQDNPKVSAPQTKVSSNQNKVSDSEPKQEPSKKEDNSPTINCALVGNIDILNQPFTVGIIKEGDNFHISGSAKFNEFTIPDLIKKFRFISENIIPKCISSIGLQEIIVNITIPEKSKDNAPEQNKTTNIGIKLVTTNNGYIKFDIEKPFKEKEDDHSKKTDAQNDEEPPKQQDENKSFYWTIEYASKKQDQPNDANDDNGIKVGTLIDSFCKGVLNPIGLDTDSLPEFIKNFTITGFTATNKPPNDSKPSNSNQNEPPQKFIDITIDTSLGSVEVQSSAPEEKPQNEIEDNSTKNSDEKTWSITYTTRTDSEGLNIHKLPVAGEILNLLSPPSDESKYEVKLSEIVYSSTNGLSISFYAFGNDEKHLHTINLPKLAKQKKEDPEPKPKQNMLMAINDSTDDESESGLGFTGNAVWKKINKTFSVLSIPKIGIGLDHKRVVFLLDASLNVSPLTFSLKEAGLGIVPKFDKIDKLDLKFYLSGFGVSFNNGVLSIGGGFYQSKNDQNTHPVYTGELLIRFKEIGLTAIGSYQAGSMWAYLVLLAPLGGPPAFFVKGLAAGFGYNNRLILPSIEEVNSYPLIAAATGGFDKRNDPQDPSKEIDLTKDLESKIIPEKGQYFLTAGIKFTSFQIINGVLLATVSFGNDCELGLLGLAEITVPPKAGNSGETKCLAKAQLAIKASVKPSEGVFCAEAQLTNESYILTKECKLTGGFAAYAWFGDNEHSGDFVVTLGGYHPSFNKPEHYPVVPRLGLNWQVNKNISIVGEMYFALTPSCLMAGGKLSATYTQGDLKAWFIAYANMIINWKPFHYDVTIGASIGASYTLDLWLIKKTFSIELAANLHLYGPKLRGDVEISWYIISFTIHFEEQGNDPTEELTWDSFIDSFLADHSQPSSNASKANEEQKIDPRSNDILTIYLEGVIGKTPINDDKGNVIDGGIEIISPHKFAISASSKIPIDNACVRPLKNENGEFTITPTTDFIIEKYEKYEENNKRTLIYPLNKKNNSEEAFTREDILQKVPAALWGAGETQLNDEKSVIEHVCGGKYSINSTKPKLFPSKENLWIQLSDLADKNIITCGTCFTAFGKEQLSLSSEETKDFSENETSTINTKINNFLQRIENEFKDKYKVHFDNVEISNFAKEADSWLSESFFTTKNDIKTEDIWIINEKEKGE